MLLNNKEEEEIVAAIQNAERETSGEIRIHIDQKKISNSIKRVKKIFYELGMQKSKNRNAVLIYLNEKSHQIIIWGDINVYENVSQSFWNQLIAESIPSFKKALYKEGLIDIVNKVGEKLQQLFPSDENIKNELPDEISY